MYGLDLFSSIDLCSGIGGITKALEPWVRPAVYCEIDRYCQAVLLSRMAEGSLPKAPIFDDIFKFDGTQYEGIDFVVGGFPCQAVSVAGKRQGTNDEKWLWPEFARIIRQARPRWVFLENVPGLLSANSGSAMGEVLRDLAQAGFDAEWGVLSAFDVGAPHLRERWWLLAYGRQMENAERQGLPAKGDAIAGEASGGWASTRIGGSDWWSTQCRICRVVDGLSKKLDSHSGMDKRFRQKEINGTPANSRESKKLRNLRSGDAEKELRRTLGRYGGVQKTEVLQFNMLREIPVGRSSESPIAPKKSGGVPGQEVRDVRSGGQTEYPPYRQQPGQQCNHKPNDVVRILSYTLALGTWQKTLENAGIMLGLFGAFKEAGLLRQTLATLPEIWKSISDEEKEWIGLRIATGNQWCAEWPGVPRVVKGQEWRNQRLKALGNAVVSQCAREAFQRLMGVK